MTRESNMVIKCFECNVEARFQDCAGWEDLTKDPEEYVAGVHYFGICPDCITELEDELLDADDESWLDEWYDEEDFMGN